MQHLLTKIDHLKELKCEKKTYYVIIYSQTDSNALDDPPYSELYFDFYDLKIGFLNKLNEYINTYGETTDYKITDFNCGLSMFDSKSFNELFVQFFYSEFLETYEILHLNKINK